ncbi:Nitroreductase [Trichormus variabilis ATCC 29413]|uniref:Nitroreductase n=2 Tax=Anabaena variabilis TaxID=264691 RepID=Q3M5U6_TRIV2|nr:MULTISPECIES: NADPH-dependent oxidoreductase [Nostocaceae]ABA23640.1 Nitroreductase [Trichormus variabilis ATCC 29413]MBC1214967.1 NADPH-dependent oxidoreductase [Trichormus variabilis ARAD]MBC1254733.1 NADPH-dependent oxidoreductase [Trichormus variabilis V5]MBC1266084.1 NADPH-dependent oxidoreductase [Trichormus variabilis FSR]MBC1303481.1 NADPH-dependent oxidoreductase [Trichormus variabilis N2B]
MTNPVEVLRSRYGEIPFDYNIPWNDSIGTILSHRSVRSYLPDPLPPGIIELLVAAAQSAPTSANLQSWSVVAVEDEERKQELYRFSNNQAHVKQAPVFLVWLADLGRLAQIADSRGLAHVALEYTELLVKAIVDASVAAQNVTVVAESLGLGTVYIGAIRNHTQEVATLLNLPPFVFPVFGQCLGFPNPEVQPAVKPRLPQQAILHRETYKLAEQEDAIARYNDIMKQFYTEQNMNVAGDWSEHSAERIATLDYLKGCKNLRETLNNFGFKLL